ncbi:mechanosensitive ion channel family protein [Pontibacter populi]|uniref:Mechanosensitive ion channel family protein n=1 Tax=Pontibacter populi TaxID=890055 RepID=A0ABV1RY18_9BACT
MEEEYNTESNHLRDSHRIRKELEKFQAKGPGPQQEFVKPKKERTSLLVYGTVFLVTVVLYYLLRLESFHIRSKYLPLLQSLLAGVMFITVVLFFTRLLTSLLKTRIRSPVTSYNVQRIINLGAALLVVFILISTLFVNWYAAVVSLGVASLILGLALQNPITSFFGWVYILLRKPYEVGDRIKIGDMTGDVIELGYFDTTLWEFNGDYLSGDHPSGRVIRFANSKVFSEFVINYSWPLFPYIWNEIKFFVSYESDLPWVRQTARRVVQEDIGPEMARRVALYRNILAQTPVDEVEVRARGSVSFSAHDNTWIQVTVRFLVEPKRSGPVKRRLFSKLLEELSLQPERVMFPNTNMK